MILERNDNFLCLVRTKKGSVPDQQVEWLWAAIEFLASTKKATLHWKRNERKWSSGIVF